MSRILRQSTSVDVPIGPFLDSTDGVTAETALTLTQPDIRLKKNGGAWAQKNAAQTLSHEENGWYEVTLDATDTNTLGLLELAVHESGALPVWHEFLVVTANIWDSLFSTDLIQVDATQWLGGAIATPTITGVPEVDVTHWIGTAAATPTVAGVPEVDVTHWLGTAGQGAAGRPQVDLELWLGVAPNALASGRVDATVGAMQANVMTAAAAAADLTTELQAGLATSAEVAGVQSDTNDIQTRLPAALVSGRMDASVGAMAAGVVTAAAIATDAIDADALAASAVNEIADQVWDELLSGHAGVGSAGAALSAAGSAGDPWNTPLPGAYGGGTAGNIVGNNLNATVSSRATQASVDAVDDFVDTEVAAIKAKTDLIPATPAATGDAMALTAAAVDAILDDVVEGSFTMRQMLRLCGAALAGKLSGAGTATIVIRAADDSKDRITATVDASGNRSAITVDVS